jgi:lipopolysaccharide/colanic/teichoic acid biosynthesis glycosyltransferase
MTHSFYQRHGKRWFDFLLSSFGLIALSPLFLICGLLIKLSSPGPVFFRQVRTGLKGSPFRIFKFRTMFIGLDGQTSFLTAAGDSRVTPAGRWLRKTKIDELPQLINVIAGDMSLVGPRPEVPVYTGRYTCEQREILAVKPGITGLGSISFSAEEKLLAGKEDKEYFYLTVVLPYKIDLELRYCRRITLLADLWLILQTIVKLFGRPGPLMMPSQDVSRTRN